MAEPWDIPDPCHFESCAPVPCAPCDGRSIFKHPPQIPGVPVGRKILPLVRVNGQVQELQNGAYIPNQYVEPPHVQWDPIHQILNIGGRYVKLEGVGGMMYSDCKGQTLGPCVPVLSCPNFAEIIAASTGVGFKNPSNPFAGLTVILRPQSGLVVGPEGLGIDWATLCQQIAARCGGTPVTPVTPVNPVSPVNPVTPVTPVSPSGTLTRTGVPYYLCSNGNVPGQPDGTVTMTRSPSGVVTFNRTANGVDHYLLGAFGSIPYNNVTVEQFNATTSVAQGNDCPPNPVSPPSGNQTRTGIPLYNCHSSTDNAVDRLAGNTSITWTSSTGRITLAGDLSAIYRFYGGSASAATYLGTTNDTYTLAQFNAITQIAANTVCTAAPVTPVTPVSPVTPVTPAPAARTINVHEYNFSNHIIGPVVGSARVTWSANSLRVEVNDYWGSSPGATSGYGNLYVEGKTGVNGAVINPENPPNANLKGTVNIALTESEFSSLPMRVFVRPPNNSGGGG